MRKPFIIGGPVTTSIINNMNKLSFSDFDEAEKEIVQDFVKKYPSYKNKIKNTAKKAKSYPHLRELTDNLPTLLNDIDEAIIELNSDENNINNKELRDRIMEDMTDLTTLECMYAFNR